MNVMRRLTCLVLVLLLAAALAPAALAEMVFSGEKESLDGDYDATVFLAGENPASTADVKGILFAAGKNVNVSGSGEYAFLAGSTVTLSGDVSRDAFVAGQTLYFTGDCARDMAAAGSTLEIRGSVGRDLLAAAKTIVLSGHVGGDVSLSAESITVAEGASIDGTLSYNSSASISAPAEILARAQAYEDRQDGGDEIAAAQPRSVPALAKLKSAVFGFVGVLVIAYFLLWLTPLWEKLDADYAGKAFGTYAASFGIGFGVLAGVPIAAILLMVTGCGLRPALALLFVYCAALAASPVFLSFFLGSLLWRRALKKARHYWAELAVGALLWAVLTALPFVSFPAKLVTAALGLGVPARMLGKKRASAPALPES